MQMLEVNCFKYKLSSDSVHKTIQLIDFFRKVKTTQNSGLFGFYLITFLLHIKIQV